MAWQALVGGIAGGLLGMEGQSGANRQNKRIADAQMQFQERMSSTAHQRQVEDLKKAGLNPLLSANAGASSPGGASATMQNPMAGLAASASDAYNSYLATKKQKAEVELLSSQKGKTQAETRALGFDAAKGEAANSIWKTIKGLWKSKGRMQTVPDKYKPKIDYHNIPEFKRSKP